MTSSHYERARLLVGQSRFEQAASELAHQLAAEPDHAAARSLLAVCLVSIGRPEDAEREARTAIRDAPELDFAHYALAVVLDNQDRLDEAERAAAEALRLDPEDADYHALLASIYLQRRQWQAALGEAERGLSLDAEHTPCANLRAIALRQLGRAGEASREIDSALGRDPENPITHLNQGWQMIEVGEYDRALEHFREALRLDPSMDAAREGVVEVLRARNPLYRPILRYFLFMSKLQGWAVWGVFIGIWLLQRVLRTAMRERPETVPYPLPIFILLVLFIVLTWISRPLFNLLLRLNPIGRFALTRQETLASNIVGGLLLAGIALGMAAYFASSLPLAIAAGACLLMMVPVSGTAECERPKPRRILLAYTIVLAVAAMLGVSLLAAGAQAAFVPLAVFGIGFVIFSWVANGLMLRT